MKDWAKLNTTNYYNFLNNIISSRGQWNDTIRCSEDGCSRHHIIPRAFHSEPKKLTWDHHENVIWLTHYEHLIAHKILAYDNSDNSLACSGYIFFRNFCEQHKLTTDNIEDIEAFNKIYHKAQSREGTLNGMYGRHHSEATKVLMNQNHIKHVWTPEERLKQSGRASSSRWYTNGCFETFASSPPKGYYLGRKPGTNKGSKNSQALKCYVYNIDKQLLEVCDCINVAGLKYGLKDREAKRHTGWDKGPYKGFYFIKEKDVI